MTDHIPCTVRSTLLVNDGCEKPFNFLGLPRELRDEVYKYLLSIEYTKHDNRKPHLHNMRRKHCYCLHTSILYTTRQISNEASQTFYKSNLFVYVYCGQDQAQELFSSGWELIAAKARKVKHYAMKIVILSTGSYNVNDYGEPKFLITYNELPKLCRTLLIGNRRLSGSLASIQLRLVIHSKVVIGGACAEGHKTVAGSPARGPPSRERTAAPTSINITSSAAPLRVRKLFEPFRQLHGIHDPQIIGPVPEHYKAEMMAEMRKRLPNNRHLFDVVLGSFQEVMDDFGSKDFTLSTLELKDTLDELIDAKRVNDQREIHDEVMSGPYAGYTIWEAYNIVEFAVWTNLAWACVKTSDFTTVYGFFMWIVPRFIGKCEREWVNATRGGYKIGMVFYLHSRNVYRNDDCSDYLDDAIRALQKGMQYEPDNQLLAHELEGCRELAAEKKIRKSAKVAVRLMESYGTISAQTIYFNPSDDHGANHLIS